MSGLSADEVREAIERARRRFDRERRTDFARFGIGEDCLWPASRLFHLHSMLGPAWQPSLTVEDVERLTYDGGYKAYPEAELLPLQRGPVLAMPIEAVIRARRSQSEFSRRPLPLAALAKLLDLGAGVTSEERLPRRAAPSGGALYPVETYPMAIRVEALESRVYHYRPTLHALEALNSVSDEALTPFMPPALAAASPPLVIALSAVFDRTQAKYLERGYRFALLECGHIVQNLLLASTALGLAALPVGGFWDEPFNALLGLDPEQEAVLYAVLIGWPAEP